MMRWVRRITAGLLAPPTVIVAAVLGTLAALLWSPPGRALTARVATDMITRNVNGRVEIGAIRGNVINHLVLEDLRISDSAGGVVIATPRLELRYLLPELVAGRLVFSELRAERPVVHLSRLRTGRWNYEEVFRVKTGGVRTGPRQRVELRNVTLSDASIRIDVPTTPKLAKVPISRHAKTTPEPRIERGADGPVRVYELTALHGRFPLIRVSTPDNDPLLVQIDELRTRLSDPALTITSAKGELVTAADSLRFKFDQAQLPGTTLSGGGAVRWPKDTVLFDFSLDADTVDLADLRWISPDFPNWQGKGRVTALSSSGARTDYTLTNLVLGDGSALAAGRLVAAVDVRRGLGMNELDLALRNVPLSVVRPYLDTLPFDGTLTGRLTTDGFLERMTLGGDLTLVDALVPGMPQSRFVFGGVIRFGGKDGAVFERFRLAESVVDLRTVQRIIPAIVVPGDLRLSGQLDGPWLNARFDGRAEHVAPNTRRSIMNGTVRFDARGALLGLALDADFSPISFDGLRTGYPLLKAQGTVSGRITATGPLDQLELLADLTGEIGVIHARGRVGLNSPRFSADGLVLDVERLDLKALLGQPTPTSLNGRIIVSGVTDPAMRAPEGQLDVALTESTFGAVSFASIVARARVADGVIQVDTATVAWRDGQVEASGSIGYAAPDSGSLTVIASATSLTSFDSLARATLGFALDSVMTTPLDGQVRANMTVAGSLDDATVTGTFVGRHLVIDTWKLDSISGAFVADSLGAGGLTLMAKADSFRMGPRHFRDLEATVSGRPDSLALAGRATTGLATLGGGGQWRPGETVSVLDLDSLSLAFPRQQWRLADPVRLTISDGRTVLSDTLTLRAVDGSGSLSASGAIPGTEQGELRVSVIGVELADVFAVIDGDSLGASGLVTTDFRLGGTRLAPTLRGGMSITGPVIGEVKAPLTRAAFDYQDSRLRSNLSFWKTGTSVLEVDVSVPYDLALAARTNRRLPGPIEITAIADSADLSLLEAFTPSMRSTGGYLQLDLRGTGTWAAPRLGGKAAIIGGRTTLPSLGVRYAPIELRARFTGDSMVVDTLLMSSGGGDMNATGVVRFAQLTSPRLDLQIRSDGFLAVDVPGFMTLRPTGDVTLTGRLVQPVMRGTAVGVSLAGSDIYFADLLNKDVINLEDPAYADLVDTTVLRRQGLGAQFQSRFLDSLRVENLRFRLGSDVWLRSNEANIQLEGELLVDKSGQEYNLVGDLNTPRGTYTLKILGLNRDFEVERGTVRYFGTTDLNASLDVLARHVVRTPDGDEIPIQAQISGTILVPTLKLSSPGRNIAERDLISYLVFGRPEFQVAGSGESEAFQLALGALSSEIERVVVEDFGLGVETIDFRPGFSPGSASSFSTLAVGRQFGSKWFVAANVGICLGAQSSGFGSRNFGASVEYRFARDWRLQASAEPVQSCSSNRASDLLANLQNRYQLGADLLWKREY